MQAAFSINGSLLRTMMKRFWPLWLGFLAAWILLYVMSLSGHLVVNDATSSGSMLSGQLSDSLNIWRTVQACVPFIAWIFAIIAVRCLNERLFASEAATFYGSLPLRRGTVCLSLFLAALLPMILVEAIVACILAIITFCIPDITIFMVLEWFVFALASSFIMCALAQFCCELTGRKSMAVAFYVFAGMFTFCTEESVRYIMNALIFGTYSCDSSVLELASPLTGLMTCGVPMGIIQWVPVGCYVLVGIALLVFALWLDIKRDLESAGETVAFDVLRPVLKYFAGVCAALLVGDVACMFMSSNTGDIGMSGAVVLFVAMALGAFLGLLYAQMNIMGSSRVWGSVWKGSVVLACLCAVFAGTCYCDPFGLVNRVMDAEEIASVQLLENEALAAEVTSEEGIEAVRELHQDILENRSALNDDLWQGNFSETSLEVGYTEVEIAYKLKDGTTDSWSYEFVYYCDDADGPHRTMSATTERVLSKAYAVANGDEGKLSCVKKALEDLDNTEITLETDEDVYDLSKEQRADFLENVLEKDIGNIDSACFDMTLSEESSEEAVRVGVYGDGEICYYAPDAEKTPNTIAWIKANYPQVYAEYEKSVAK